MFEIKYVQLYFKQDWWEDETTFSKHNSEFPPEEQLALLLSTIPKSSSLSRLLNLHTADFQQSHRESLTFSLFVNFFPTEVPRTATQSWPVW